MMEHTDGSESVTVVTTTDPNHGRTTVAVAQSSPDARPPIRRNSFRQQRSVTAEIAVNSAAADATAAAAANERHGRIHGHSELGYTITVYPQFFRTMVGVFKIVEIIISIIVCTAVDAFQCISGILCGTPSSPLWYGVLSGQGFVLFVGVFCILGNAVFIGYHILKRPVPISTLADRVRTVERIYVILCAVLFAAAACVECWYASWTILFVPNRDLYDNMRTQQQFVFNPYRPQWIAAAVFAFLNALVYAAEAVCLFFFDPDAPRSGTFNK